MKRQAAPVAGEKRVKSDLSIGLYSVRLKGFLHIIREVPKNKSLVFVPTTKFYPRLGGLDFENDGDDQLLLKYIDGETPLDTLAQIHMSEIDFKTDIEWELEETEEIIESDVDADDPEDGSRSPDDSDDSDDDDYEEVSIDKFIARITDDIGIHSAPPLKMKFKLDRERMCATLFSLTYQLKA